MSKEYPSLGTLEYDRKRKRTSPPMSVPPPVGSGSHEYAGGSSAGLGLGLGDEGGEEASKRGNKKQQAGAASLTSESDPFQGWSV